MLFWSQTGKGEADDSQTAGLFTADGTYTIVTTDILLLLCFFTDTKDNVSEPFDEIASSQQSVGKITAYNHHRVSLT